MSEIFATVFTATCWIAGPLAEIIGRKWVLLLGSPLLIISFILLMIANKVWILIFARAIQGFAVGFTMTVLPLYVSEISTDSVRGATGSFMQLGIVSGVLYVYAIGPYVSYQALQWFCIAVPIVFTAIFAFMPESPHYYISKNKVEEASKSLQFLRGQSAEAVKVALEEIENFVKESAAHKGSLRDVFKTPGNRKALLISTFLLAFQQLSGNTAVLFNTQSIFQAANTGTDAAISAIIVGIIQVAASALTPLLADRLGRKIILLICSTIMCVALFALGAYFFIQIAGGDTSNIFWLPFSALIVYIIFYSVSFGPLPWVILGETFPANVKPAASSFSTSSCLLTGSLISFFYPLLNDLGSYYIFWLFAISCAIAFIFILIVVFETKGLSLQEIQNKLNKRDIVQ